MLRSSGYSSGFGNSASEREFDIWMWLRIGVSDNGTTDMVMLIIISSNLKIWIDMVENCAFLLSIILSHSHFVLFFRQV